MTTKEEIADKLIEQFSKYQRIKKDNAGHNNPSLDYEIKVMTARLSALGVNVEDLTLK